MSKKIHTRVLLLLCWFMGCIVTQPGFSQKLHTAPIVITGKQIIGVTRFPIAAYRLFRTLPNGKAESIPFQIDEINEDGDYVLDQGTDVTAKTGNGIFDLQDELALMGDDVGPVQEPSDWPMGRPQVLYELRVAHPTANPMGPQMGAVYIGIYFAKAPPLNERKYVVFDREQAEVRTSRYQYQFDQRNWLVAKKVAVARPDSTPPVYDSILDSTTFYMKGDLKYFVTVEANHRSIESQLEAWRTGAVRSIVRVSFFYRLLSLKLELGMYTEISFFTNAVYLPAIMYNPIDGHKSLNPGSGMYYGLSLKENPIDYTIDTNMAPYEFSTGLNILDSGKQLLGNFLRKPKDVQASQGLYWVSAQGNGKSLYLEITPSPELQKGGVAPTLYRENHSAADMRARNNDEVLPLSKSPVNLGVYFDATKFSEGEHVMGFRLFFENVLAPERLAVFKSLNQWIYTVKRLKSPTPGVPQK